jgi:polar amino acid transport system substrate-binding protein
MAERACVPVAPFDVARTWVALVLVLLFTLGGGFGDEKPFPAAVARGALIVAVPTRPEPILYVGKVDRSQRAPDGFSAALAEELGKRAGLPVRLLLADGKDASAAVRSGLADVAVSQLSFSPDASVALAPTAYTSGRGLALVLRHGKVQSWRDLANRTICTAQGSSYASQAAERGQARLQRFDRPLDALLAFQAGECDALVDDEYVIRKLLKQPDWSYYRALPGAVAAAPSYIATRQGDLATALFVEKTIEGWRRQRWLANVREGQAVALSFEMFNAENDLYCH